MWLVLIRVWINLTGVVNRRIFILFDQEIAQKKLKGLKTPHLEKIKTAEMASEASRIEAPDSDNINFYHQPMKPVSEAQLSSLRLNLKPELAHHTIHPKYYALFILLYGLIWNY